VVDYAPRDSGLLVRSTSNPIVPNGNDPASVPPATVGPPSARAGDPNGLELISTGSPSRFGPPRIRASTWSGWPSEWDTPNFANQIEALTDTAWTCLDLNASLISTMPPYLVGASANLPDEWLNNPDPMFYASWEEFAKQVFWDFMLGEVFILTTARYASGYPARFHVVPPWFVNAEMIDGERHYSIGSIDVTADLLHIRYTSTTGFARGTGPLEVGRSRLVAASVLIAYGTNLATSGGVPYAVLTYPGELSKTQAEDLQERWLEARLSRMGLPAVLSGGVTFDVLQLSPADMGLLELLHANEARIAVLLGVPPFLIAVPSGADKMTYKNVEHVFDYHWRAGLRPKAQTVMSALSNWLLPRGTRVEVNRDAYIQPDPLERAQTAQILNSIRDDQGRPVLTVQEIREGERLENTSPDVASGVLRG
jgi:HK97 family phage portal protein